ncbi:formylglycine-generating enzyme family protein [Mycobacterium sp. C3-094]
MLTELVALDGGRFRMGSTQFYPEEAPAHTVTVDAFAIERHPVTNAQFAAFVADTGYRTVAELAPDPAAYPGASPDDLVPGALVFRPTGGPVDLRDWRQWWEWVPGANWRQPHGPGSSADADHPVVQVCYADALAYARWADRRLPTEAEWEFAARGGASTIYPWGDEAAPGGEQMANIWQGDFPYRHTGRIGTTPVGTFPPNAHGLVDMIGNVWEWTTTRFAGHHQLAERVESCCGPSAPDAVPNPAVNQALKGGSHLCAPEYCHRYRPTARSPQSQDSATTHIGFRCVAGAR